MVRVIKYNCILVKEESHNYKVNKKICEPSDGVLAVNNIFKLNERAEEYLVMLALNTKKEIIGTFEISHGSKNSSVVHPAEIFKRLLLCNASSFVIAHNHPSDGIEPSIEDIDITIRIQEAGKILGIKLLDHYIITSNEYLSLKDRCIM